MASVKTVKELHTRAVKKFLDILVLEWLRDEPLSAYDVIALVRERRGISLSAGIAYNMLYFLEREGLIRDTGNQGKRVYELTGKGKQRINTITEASEEIQSFLRKILLPES